VIGDATSARLELQAARAGFEQLGATPAAVAVAHRLGDDAPLFVDRTFMFTDTVNSTELLTAIGDEAWNAIRLRHHRCATTIFAEHDGCTVKELGDGFFVVFDDAALAVGSAIALQRQLDEQRRSDGFALRVCASVCTRVPRSSTTTTTAGATW
jgi:class 3 adenylate cyclase